MEMGLSWEGGLKQDGGGGRGEGEGGRGEGVENLRRAGILNTELEHNLSITYLVACVFWCPSNGGWG